MPNNLNSNPLVIQNSVVSYKTAVTASVGTLFSFRVMKVYWENPGTIGDVVTIGDPASGMTLLNLRCEVAGQSQVVDWTAFPVLWRDFSIDTISSGTLYIYYAL